MLSKTAHPCVLDCGVLVHAGSAPSRLVLTDLSQIERVHFFPLEAAGFDWVVTVAVTMFDRSATLFAVDSFPNYSKPEI
jgi:hypothetical protein